MQVLGIDVLMNCKGAGALGGFISAVYFLRLYFPLCFCGLFLRFIFAALFFWRARRARVVSRACDTTEPEKQFALVERHVARIRAVRNLALSQIVIMVERNLG